MAESSSVEGIQDNLNDESPDYGYLRIIKTSKSKREVDSAIIALWEKYKPAIVKARQTLYSMTSCCVNPLDSDVFEDYVDESFETFMKAVNVMDLKRITNKGTWMFYICLAGYLQAHNRTIITEHRKRCENETPEWTFVDSSGDELSIFDTAHQSQRGGSPLDDMFIDEETKILQKAINNSYAGFSELQKDMWRMRLNGLNKTEVSDILNLSSADVTRNFRQMKKMIKSEIAEYSARSRITNIDWS